MVSQDVFLNPVPKQSSSLAGLKKGYHQQHCDDSSICDTYLLRIFWHVGRFFAPETLHYIPLDDCAIYWNNSMSSTFMGRKPKGGNKKVNLTDADLSICVVFTLTGHNMRGKTK